MRKTALIICLFLLTSCAKREDTLKEIRALQDQIKDLQSTSVALVGIVNSHSSGIDENSSKIDELEGLIYDLQDHVGY